MSTPIDPQTTYTISEEQLARLELAIPLEICPELIAQIRRQRVVPAPKPHEFVWQKQAQSPAPQAPKRDGQ